MKRIFAFLLSGIFPLILSAQQPQSPEAHEKKLAESIENEVDRLRSLLKLEDWQVFYADSILNHNLRATDAEMKRMNDAKVSNFDLYMEVGDKWAEKTYEAFRKIFTEDQWEKYNKTGAAREKKSREKRRERNKK